MTYRHPQESTIDGGLEVLFIHLFDSMSGFVEMTEGWAIAHPIR